MEAETCPICGEPQLLSPRPGVFDCQYCHARIINGQLICPACKRSNELGQEHCVSCGEPLSLIGAVISRQRSGSGSQRLDQLRSQADEIKAVAEEHSHVRMSSFKAMDQQRIKAEKEAAIKQQQRDKELFRYTAIGVGIFLLIVAIISLIVIL